MAAARWDARCPCACWLSHKPVMALRTQAQGPASVKSGQGAWLCTQQFSTGLQIVQLSLLRKRSHEGKAEALSFCWGHRVSSAQGSSIWWSSNLHLVVVGEMGNDWQRGRGRGRGRGGRRPASTRPPGRGGGGPMPKPSSGPPPEEALKLRVLGIGPDFLAHFDDLIGMPITTVHVEPAQWSLVLYSSSVRQTSVQGGPWFTAGKVGCSVERAADSTEQRLRLAAWDDLGRLIAWFRDALAADNGVGRDAELAFSHMLSKEHRAQVSLQQSFMLACWP